MTTTNSPAHHRSLGDHTWHTKAACRPSEHNPIDPDIFFPEPDEMDRIRAAKRLCDQCPVSEVCLDAALEQGDTHGIRGGKTEEERVSMHKNLAARLDYSRVNATLAGRDIHLTRTERRAVAYVAYRQGITVERLARMLKITEEHARKLYRETRRALRNRDLAQKSGTNQSPGHGNTGNTSSTKGARRRKDFGTAA